VHRVRAAPGSQVDDTAVEAAEFRRRAVAFNLEFLNRVDHGDERRLAWLGLQYRDAVEEIFVGARPAPVDARKLRSGWERHSGRQRGQRDEAAAVQRELENPLVVHDRAQRRALRAQQCCIRLNGNPFNTSPDGKVEIDPDCLAGRETDALAAYRPETRDIDIESIRAGSKACSRIHTGRRRHDDSRALSVDGRDYDTCSRHDRAGLVANHPAHFTGADLAEGINGVRGSKTSRCRNQQTGSKGVRHSR